MAAKRILFKVLIFINSPPLPSSKRPLKLSFASLASGIGKLSLCEASQLRKPTLTVIRAKFIVQSCQTLAKLGGEPYLKGLRSKTSAEVREVGAELTF